MLTAEEVRRLTGKVQWRRQVSELNRLGIRHHVNLAGEVIVARELGEKFLGVTRKDPAKDLNFPAMRRLGIVSSGGETPKVR